MYRFALKIGFFTNPVLKIPEIWKRGRKGGSRNGNLGKGDCRVVIHLWWYPVGRIIKKSKKKPRTKFELCLELPEK